MQLHSLHVRQDIGLDVIVGTEQIVQQQAEELVLIMEELCIGNMIIGGTNKNMTNTQAYTFASHTNLDTSQNLQKSMLSPIHSKNKKSSLSLKNKTLQTHSPTDKNGMTESNENKKGMSLDKKEGQLVTGGCCQWRDCASYDRDVHIETFVLRGNFCGKIATEQQPPNRYNQ